ncbi:peptidoglycan-binding protein [Aureimonas sp. Leaf324]|jgi:GH24 family phage-related lysozyme (muramidase)|uniref:peptidoglycan-binding protein n=1 Tax=Aureimonas sp. Leaf324 TaxID=1736336 RepID=UPI0006FBE203|nr:peptidoglycan-binding protein [Aureimonas sp. Leaf324]KQQ85085.1 hypothetical protein ASF65_19915 [Aureimonas sp. Leaf324]
MEISAPGVAFTGAQEGFVARYYLDPVKIGTIGKGFTWASSAFRVWWAKHKPGIKFGPGATMTRAEADDAFLFLMREEYGAAVNEFLGREVPQHAFDGMGSVVFNAGAGTLTDRWAQAAKRGDWMTAAELLKTTRTTAKGVRLKGLVSRRLDEAELISLGDYTIGRPAEDAMADGMLVRGEKGSAVEKLQRDLQTSGFYSDGKPDGNFGPGTEAAVMEFQRSVGLDDDGFAGPRTLRALVDAIAPRAVAVPIPTPRPEVDAPAAIVSIPASVLPPVPAGLPAIVGSVNKAVGAAVGAAKGSAVAPAITLIGAKLGIIPAWVLEPEYMAAFLLIGGVVIAAAWAFISTYRAPANE